MTLRRKPILIGAAVLLAAAALVLVNLRREAGRKTEVEVEVVRARSIKAVVSASGSIRAKRTVEVSASQMGTVVDVAVEEGDEVAEGADLLQIDPVAYRQSVERLRAASSSARADVELARSTVKQAEQEEERIRNLRANDLASPQDLLRVETEREVAAARLESALGALRQQEASLRNAEHDLGLTTIRSPMSGIVVELNVEEGETAIIGTMNNPGTVLLTIADLSELEAEVEVDETDVVDLRPGMPAKVSIDSYPDTLFDGSVTEIGNSAVRTAQASESVDFLVVVALHDAVPGAKPGLSATADIIVAERRDVLSVPMQSLTIRRVGEEGDAEEDLDDDPTARKRGREKEGVFVVRAGKAVFVPAETGIAGDRYFELLSGPAEGDTVVSGDFEAIRDLEDGDPVRVAPPKKEEKKKQ
ncbi:MAG: efflux RND transporter periplasmic adaptor subunit [Candidatus Latescibacterota bacterium]|nr:MAG: efflux RND transporter periplasmic adaptor subunit [Candidatus Latescibacterota bacterium]